MKTEQKNHWNKVYQTKQPNEVSWTQPKPESSLDFIHHFPISKSSPIIDIGGGDSTLVDFLLAEGYENISVLDISELALERAKLRLGKLADKVTWIISDITTFIPLQKYMIWHDRATFHFLTTEEQINDYMKIVTTAVAGYLIIGTFSEQGPDKCSGLEIKKYSKDQLICQFINGFEKIQCVNQEHITPFNTLQNFTFCSFKRIEQ
ncbi:MAG: class I SAM-dependent methyltransferase [Cytophagales bacterium]|nr:class I SAM-dependent methyltransferase [Cytophaga sp.]